MSVTDGTRSFVRINKVVNGWTWNVQVTEDTTVDELQELKAKALQLNDELFDELLPQPEEPEF